MRRTLLALGLAAALGAPAVARAGDPQPAPGPSETERAEIRRIVQEMREEAARLRGLPWKRDVPADLLSRDQLAANLVEEVQEEYTPEEIARDTKILRRMGLLKEGEDVVGMMLYMLREMVAGYFDPKTERLYLIEGLGGEAQRPTILHELVHALEHQHIDLEKRTRPHEDEPDRLFAEKCIQEGSAEQARMLYEKDHPEIAKLSERAQATPENARRQIDVLLRVPAYLFVPTLLHYDVGPKLVRQYVGDEYGPRMDALYAAPPTTQEQCLHPERWLGERKDLPRTVRWGGNLVAALGEGWKKTHELSQGELDLALFVDFHLGFMRGRVNPLTMSRGVYVAPAAAKAARGWDAGRDVYVEKEGLPLGWISALAFDSAEDAREAADAIAAAVAKIHGAAAPPGAWVEGATDGRATRRMDLSSALGQGRILVRGDEVLVADGFPAEALAALWPVLEKTTFERDPADGY